MKHFHFAPFALTFTILGVLLVPGLFGALATDEGTSGNHENFWLFFSELFHVLRFPTHTLLWDLFSSSTVLFFLGLLLNLTFYGLAAERLFALFKNLKKNA